MRELSREEIDFGMRRETPRQLQEYKLPEKTKIIKKGTFWFFTILSLTILATISANLIWFNILVSKDKIKPEINTEIITPEIPVTIDDKDTNNYEHKITNEITADISEQDKEEIIDDIIDGVLDGLNDILPSEQDKEEIIDDIIDGVLDGLNET